MYIASQAPIVVGNGCVAAMTRTGVMNVAGVFSGDLDQGKKPVRAAMPSFWDGYAITSLAAPYQTLQDYASAIDVGASAVYAIGLLASSGGVSVEARRHVNQINVLVSPRICSRTLPISVLSERQPATSIYADGRSSDDVIAF